MTEMTWTIKGREFGHCNCAYGCPCQFNARPTYGDCRALLAIQIDEGHHGDTRLDGLKMAGICAWPGPIHEGKGEGLFIIEERATPAQRDALLRIAAGKDTEPGATFLQVFSSTLEKKHTPIFTTIDFDIDVAGRKARVVVPGVIEARGEPIRNPVTGDEHRARIDLPNGFEFAIAEMGRGWGKTSGAIVLDLADSHAHFAELHLCQSGVVR